MDKMEQEEIKRLLHDVLTEYKAINDEVHATHHAFIEMMIKKEERRIQRWETIKTQVGGWSIILILGFIGKTMWTFFREVIR